MEYNAFVLRATVDELLRRRYDDYEELLRREINAQVDDFVKNALAVRAFRTTPSTHSNSFGSSNQPVIQQQVQPSFIFPSRPASIAFPTQSSISIPRISSSVVLPPSQPTLAPTQPQQPTQQQTEQEADPAPVNIQPAERAAAGGGSNLGDALASINGHVAAAASSVSAALASSTSSASDKDGGDDKKTKHGLSPGAIVGIVACVILVILLIITIFLYLHRKGGDDEGDDESVAPQDADDYEKGGADQGNMQEIPLDHNGPDYGAAYQQQQHGEPAYPVQQQQQPYSAYDNAPYHGGYPGPQHGVPDPGYLHTAPPQLPDPFQDPHHQAVIRSPFDHPADQYAAAQPPHSAYAGPSMTAGPSGYGHGQYAQDVPHSPTSSHSSFSSAPSSPRSPGSPDSHLHHQKSRKLLKVVNA